MCDYIMLVQLFLIYHLFILCSQFCEINSSSISSGQSVQEERASRRGVIHLSRQNKIHFQSPFSRTNTTTNTCKRAYFASELFVHLFGWLLVQIQFFHGILLTPQPLKILSKIQKALRYKLLTLFTFITIFSLFKLFALLTLLTVLTLFTLLTLLKQLWRKKGYYAYL